MIFKVSAMNPYSEDKGILFKLARRTIEEVLAGKSFNHMNIDEGSLPETLKVDRGVFVTIYKDNDLRGCIGNVLPLMPLWRATIENARNAAFRDSRFPPLRVDEYPGISIEISVLSKSVKMLDINEFCVGLHGIVLKKGIHFAVFLPQIPSMQGWSASETMQRLSEKAGLEPDGWKEADSLEIFHAEVFSESDLVSAG
ncbi:MAG: AmmeMemoRadiSam system protein A [Deltaproteobacteria bacterium]|nr:AmmeMemoRadiSam system protein A [Deltaproteobacteria bacterium]